MTDALGVPVHDTDEHWMRHALALAERAQREFDEIPVCVGYRHRGEVLRGFPASPSAQAEAEPVYRTVRGWRRETVGIRAFEDLPEAARDYVALLEEEVGAPVWLVSTGPRREETILRGDAGLEALLGGRRRAVEAGLAPAG